MLLQSKELMLVIRFLWSFFSNYYLKCNILERDVYIGIVNKVNVKDRLRKYFICLRKMKKD